MPDDELLNLGEKNQLRAPGVLKAQIKRMIADPKSSAFAENFTGQWLETRSLDAIKPDAKATDARATLDKLALDHAALTASVTR